MSSSVDDYIARSDRERWGLRGAVKVLIEEHLQTAVAHAIPVSSKLRIEFTEKGAIVGGKLVPFSFDETGRKIRTRIARSEDYVPNRSVGGSPFSIADRKPNLPDGGIATTYYDENDRPVEVLVRNSQNELVSRARRTYGVAGNVLGESLTIDNPGAFIPASLKSKISSDESIKQWLAARAGTYSEKYFYDSKGHKICTLGRSLEEEEMRATAYNDHDDVELEVIVKRPIGTGGQPVFSYSEARYSYQYDEAGNWTERTAEYASGLDASPSTKTIVRRSLEYF